MAEKEAGGDRPVLGGPWKSKREAKTAAAAFCDRGKEARTMAAKQLLHNEETRRGIQRGVDRRANAEKAALDPKEGDVALDKKSGAVSIPKDDVAMRKIAPPARRYWPSANSQRSPRRPQVRRRSPK